MSEYEKAAALDLHTTRLQETVEALLDENDRLVWLIADMLEHSLASIETNPLPVELRRRIKAVSDHGEFE